MKAIGLSLYGFLSFRMLAFSVLFSAMAGITAGCGGRPGLPPPEFSGNTNVTVLLASTANDQLSAYAMSLVTLTLTNKAGKAITIFNAPEMVEFIRLNGNSQPAITATVPQGIYTSAALAYTYPAFTCATVNSRGGLVLNTFGGIDPAQIHPATVELSSPISVTGTAMSLQLNLLVSRSASYSTCDAASLSTIYSLTPTFSLAPVTISSQPTNEGNGKQGGIEGRIVSADPVSGDFTVSTANGSVFSSGGTGTALAVKTDTSTVFQGIADFSSLITGMFVDIDVTIQANGSLRAARIAVEDANARNVMVGPLEGIYGSDRVISIEGRQQQGDDLTVQPANYLYYSFDSNTNFRISGQFQNLQDLPFQANFIASSMVSGQNAYVSSPSIVTVGGSYTPATTITLMPQTINGTVTAISTSGVFTVYSVALASYDLIPTLVAVTGQSTSLQNPGIVYVYSDNNTQVLSSTPAQPGSVLRFNGLLFNDNGTLRMDCAQVFDGVAE